MKVSELQAYAKSALAQFGDIDVIFLGISSSGQSYLMENPCCGILDINANEKDAQNLRFFVGFHKTHTKSPNLKVVK